MLTLHEQSQKLAAMAEVAPEEKKQKLYREAALAELQALDELEIKALQESDFTLHRTLGITVLSVCSLFFKAGDDEFVKTLASKWLQTDLLPAWAIDQLQCFLDP